MEVIETITGNLVYIVFLFLLIAIPLTFIFAVWKRNDLAHASKIMWMIFFIVGLLSASYATSSLVINLAVNDSRKILEITGVNALYLIQLILLSAEDFF